LNYPNLGVSIKEECKSLWNLPSALKHRTRLTERITSLKRELSRILSLYYDQPDAVLHHVERILVSYSKESYLKYPLDDKAYLILSKDERKLNHLRRYSDSPFPLLSNVDRFRKTVGNWNAELLDFGLKTREKLHDHYENYERVGNRIHLAYYHTWNSKGNQYLLKQYKRLAKYRTRGACNAYWNLSWTMMCNSLSFRIASLNSWQPRWYKTFTWREYRHLFKGLHKILSLEEIQTQITNVWIESPKGKWRQLGVPNKPWRLYLHMLNMFITYQYEPKLDPRLYSGFIFNRGCKSWWEDLLWSSTLEDYPHLIEVDLSSGFPNLDRRSLDLALQSSGLLPPPVRHLILQHLASPLTESSWFPTLETYIENSYNRNWRKSSRSVHMGLGISPILFVITQDWALRTQQLLLPGLTYKWYADDGSFYFTSSGLYNLVKSTYSYSTLLSWDLYSNLFVNLLNPLPLLKSSGLKLCKKKSKWVRLFGIWLTPYISLGLKIYSPAGIFQQLLLKLLGQPIPLKLQGWTRGRGANPVTGRPSRSSSTVALDSLTPTPSAKRLSFDILLKDLKRYFGLIMSLLYGGERKESPLPSRNLWPTIKPGSILFHLYRRQKKNPDSELHLDLITSGVKLNEALLQVNRNEPLPSSWSLLNPNLERELKVEWKITPSKLTSQNIKTPFSDWKIPSDHESTAFKKYSELRLTPADYESMKLAYSQQLPRPSMK